MKNEAESGRGHKILLGFGVIWGSISFHGLKRKKGKWICHCALLRRQKKPHAVTVACLDWQPTLARTPTYYLVHRNLYRHAVLIAVLF